jgi:hypothetical protein
LKDIDPSHKLTQEQRQLQQAREYLLKALATFDEHHAEIALRNLARLWQASGDTSLPGAVAATLKIQPQEAEALLRELLEKGNSPPGPLS